MHLLLGLCKLTTLCRMVCNTRHLKIFFVRLIKESTVTQDTSRIANERYYRKTSAIRHVENCAETESNGRYQYRPCEISARSIHDVCSALGDCQRGPTDDKYWSSRSSLKCAMMMRPQTYVMIGSAPISPPITTIVSRNGQFHG